MNDPDTELLIRHLLPPAGYKVTTDEWREAIKAARCWGCDWMEYMVESHNPVIGEAVIQLCRRVEELERVGVRG